MSADIPEVLLIARDIAEEHGACLIECGGRRELHLHLRAARNALCGQPWQTRVRVKVWLALDMVEAAAPAFAGIEHVLEGRPQDAE